MHIVSLSIGEAPQPLDAFGHRGQEVQLLPGKNFIL